VEGQRLASSARRDDYDDYARRRPEETALYHRVAQHWPGFVERLEEHCGTSLSCKLRLLT